MEGYRWDKQQQTCLVFKILIGKRNRWPSEKDASTATNGDLENKARVKAPEIKGSI